MLFRREIRLNLKGFIICTAICSALSLYLIAMIPSMGTDMQEIMKMKVPKQLQIAFGMDRLDFHTPMGTFPLMFSYLYLTYGIYAASMFSRIVSKEFTEKTAEYLFSLPARKIDLIMTKLWVAIGYLSLSVGITFLASWIGFAAIMPSEDSFRALLSMGAAYWMGGMFFGALSFLLSAFYLKSRMAVGMVLGFYLLQVVLSLNESLRLLKYISPFDWFKGSDIAIGNGLSWVSVCIALVGIASCLVVGARRFVRRDVLV